MVTSVPVNRRGSPGSDQPATDSNDRSHARRRPFYFTATASVSWCSRMKRRR
jgi:hypothetical protein